MEKVKSFRDLRVWQLAHKLSIEVAELVKKFPRDEKYDLTDQMRRSARSVPSDKLTFYERANSSLNEISNHFDEALANKYITKTEHSHFSKNINEIGFLVRKMIKTIIKARDNYHAKASS